MMVRSRRSCVFHAPVAGTRVGLKSPCAIPRYLSPAVEGAERQNQPPTSLYRQVRRVSLLRLAPRKPPEAERGIGSDREITIKRNERCQSSRDSGRADQHRG
jgi:hypothetical protein